MVADLRARLDALLDAVSPVPAAIARSDRQHREIVGAILDGDPPIARAEMAEHPAGTAALLRGFPG